jgi:glucose/arabinose dehydrogenase
MKKALLFYCGVVVGLAGISAWASKETSLKGASSKDALAKGVLAKTEGLPPIHLDRLKLPPGFKIELVARVPNARQMALSSKGILFVGSRQHGSVHFLDMKDPSKVYVLAEKLEQPSGLTLKGDDLYVSEISKIHRFPKASAGFPIAPQREWVTDQLPDKTHHGWKFIAFGPDGKLYVPVGAPCNLCNEDKKDFATIRRMNADGSGMEVIARGVRNTVGFDWHPKTKELWFTDNGRDWLGDDSPPDELNRLAKKGSHFGYPFCHGGSIPDPEFGRERKCADFVPPVQNLGAHVAALGMRFSASTNFPERYKNGIFIAEHGSWNRSKKNGYRVAYVRLKGSESSAYEPFLHGFVQDEKAWGRPADVLVEPSGSLLVSDDHAGAIYRISVAD